MNIRMRQTMQGSNSGFDSAVFLKGEEYTVGKGIHEDLAKVFLKEGWAEEVKAEEPKKPEEPEEPEAGSKDAGSAKANKNGGAAPKNKKKG